MPHTWTQEEEELLIGWMEDNVELVLGRQTAWHKDVKEEVFGDDDDITGKIITDKISSLKRSWKKAKTMEDSDGWGVDPNKGERYISEVLEEQCSFYERLDEIWGTQPIRNTPSFPKVQSDFGEPYAGRRRGSAATSQRPPRAPRTVQQPLSTPATAAFPTNSTPSVSSQRPKFSVFIKGKKEEYAAKKKRYAQQAKMERLETALDAAGIKRENFPY